MWTEARGLLRKEALAELGVGVTAVMAVRTMLERSGKRDLLARSIGLFPLAGLVVGLAGGPTTRGVAAVLLRDFLVEPMVGRTQAQTLVAAVARRHHGEQAGLAVPGKPQARAKMGSTLLPMRTARAAVGGLGRSTWRARPWVVMGLMGASSSSG